MKRATPNKLFLTAALLLPLQSAPAFSDQNRPAIFILLEQQDGIRSRLDHKIAAVNVQAARLDTLLLQVSTGVGVRITPDWPALQKVGVTPQSTITLQGKGISYSDLLEAVAEQTKSQIAIYFREEDSTLGLTSEKEAAGSKGTIGQGRSGQVAFQSLVPPRVRPVGIARAHVANGGARQHSATNDPVDTPADLDTPADNAARKQLENTVNELQLEQVGLERAIDKLRDSCPVTFVVNWTALQVAGIDKNTPVSLNLRRVPVRAALTTLLSAAGGGAANLHFTLRDGMVVISTQDDLNSAAYQTVSVFDIRDLILSEVHGDINRNSDDVVKDVVDTIKTTIAPESWRDAGGQIGSVRELNGKLIVNQTRDNQIAVSNLLNELREKRTLPKKK